MKKSFLPALLILGLSTITFTACETTGALADTLMDISTIAAVTGDKRLATYLEAGAKTTRALEDITPEEEYYIGRAVAATVLSNYSVYNDSAKEQYANKICRAIAVNCENPDGYNGYHVKLLDSDEINAFATSSGIIFITKGLYNSVSSEDQLASVIAHEMGHILLRHSTSAIKSSRWTEAGVSTAGAVLVAKTDKENIELASLMSDMVGDAASTLLTNGYSKNQEYDADTKALELLADAGYNPSAMLEMLNILNELSGRNKTGMFQTHPSPKSRFKNAKFELGAITIPEDTSSYRTERFKS